MNEPELCYEDMTDEQKAGLKKYWSMTSDEMKLCGEQFKEETGKNPSNIHNKGEYFTFVYKFNTKKMIEKKLGDKLHDLITQRNKLRKELKQIEQEEKKVTMELWELTNKKSR